MDGIALFAINPLLLFAPFLRLQGQGGRQVSQQPPKADGIARFLPVAVGAIVNARQRLFDLAE